MTTERRYTDHADAWRPSSASSVVARNGRATSFQVAVFNADCSEVPPLSNDPLYDRTMMAILHEEAHALSEHSRALRKYATETVLRSRELRRRAAAVSESVHQTYTRICFGRPGRPVDATITATNRTSL